MAAAAEVKDREADLIPTAERERAASTIQEDAVRSFFSSPDENDKVRVLFCFCPGNVAVLILTTALFGSITTVQYLFGFGLIVGGKSQALLGDCNSMATDTMSYFLNIFAELAPKKYKRKLQLLIPLLSLSVLAALTYMSFTEALCTVTNCDPDAPPEEAPSAWVVWAFGFFGLVFDLISIWAFCKNKHNKKEGKLPVNMLAAFMHVGADMIRSLTTTLEGFFLISEVMGEDMGDKVDAWACLVITAVIAAGLIFGIYEVVVDIMTYMKTGE